MPFNPHPPLAMFPAVLSLALVMLEILSFRGIAPARLRAVALLAFTLSITFAYYSGFFGVDYATKLTPDTIKLHQGFGRFVFMLCCPLVVVGLASALSETPIPWLRRTYWILLALTASLTLYSSFLGGQLVFRHGAGVFGVGY